MFFKIRKFLNHQIINLFFFNLRVNSQRSQLWKSSSFFFTYTCQEYIIPKNITKMRSDRRKDNQLSFKPESSKVLFHTYVSYSKQILINNGVHFDKHFNTSFSQNHVLIELIRFCNNKLNFGFKKIIKELSFFTTLFSQRRHRNNQFFNFFLQITQFQNIIISLLSREICIGNRITS